MKTFDPTKTTTYIFIGGLIGAFVAGGSALIWTQSHIDSVVTTKLIELENAGELPEGPSGPPGVSGASLPVGAILPYFGSLTDVPEGFLPCDGSVVAASKYPELYGVLIAATPGRKTSDGFVQLPDFSAKFLRGARSGDPIGSVGGSESHSHTVTVAAAEAKGKQPPGHRNDASFNMIEKHGHNASSGGVSNLPPYENVVFLIRAE